MWIFALFSDTKILSRKVWCEEVSTSEFLKKLVLRTSRLPEKLREKVLKIETVSFKEFAFFELSEVTLNQFPEFYFVLVRMIFLLAFRNIFEQFRHQCFLAFDPVDQEHAQDQI